MGRARRVGKRRSNIIILLFVLGLIAGVAAVIATKPTKIGLDLSGGTRADLPGPADRPGQPDGRPARTSTARSRSSASAIDALGVSEPEIARLGTDQIQISLPNVQNAQRAIDQVGDTAQLYFYDLEPNLIVPSSTRQSHPRALERRRGTLGATSSTSTAADPRAFHRLRRRRARLEADTAKCYDVCTTTGPSYYLFDEEEPHELRSPGRSRRATRPVLTRRGQKRSEERPADRSRSRRARSSSRAATDQAGTVDDTAEPGYFVLEDDPELSGDDITNPSRTSTRTTSRTSPSTSPTAGGTPSRTSPGRSPSAARRRRSARSAPSRLRRSPHFAIVLDNKIVSRPIIDFVENPDGIDGRTGAQISGGFTDPARRRTWRRSCRSAPCRST